MPYTYIFAVTFDDAEVVKFDTLQSDPELATNLVKRGLDFAQQGTVDAIVENLGNIRGQEEDNYGQVVVYTGFDRNGFAIDFDALDDPGLN